MTGICGLVSNRDVADLQERIGTMVELLSHHDWHVVEQSCDAERRCGLGRVSLGFVNAAAQPVTLPGSGLTAVMDGECYNAARCRRELEQSGETFDGESQAELLLRGYLRDGRDFFLRLGGKFSAAIYDRRRLRLLLVNDRFGMRPLYYAETTEGRFVFASEIKALLSQPEVSREQNATGIAQFFAFGHLWGEETLYSSIRALPPGACVEYEAEQDRLTVEHYWRPVQQPLQAADRGELLERIDAAFKQSVDEQVSDTNGLGISLSGGMDARTILATVDNGSVPLKALCMGMPGSRDQRSAREMARLAGCEYHDFELGRRFLLEFGGHLDRMVHLTDGHYLSQCIVLPTFDRYRELGIDVLLRGHAGELMHMQKAYNFSLDREGLRIDSAAALEQWCFRHLRAYMLDALDEPLFAFADSGEIDEIARGTIRRSLEDSAGWERPLDRVWQLFLTERLRRETAMSLVKFGSVVETRLPYLDPELVSLLLSAPADLKLDEEIQTHILRKRFPEFLRVTNVNTGARVGANPLVRELQHFKMRVFAKLGVPGYQPYERLGLWLRRELAPLVRELLLDDRCLNRGTFRPDAVRKVVERHLGGNRNHTYLLMAMMIYELGQRKFADGDSAGIEDSLVVRQHA